MAGSLLVITAHPDDESFFAAGTVAKYTAEHAHATIVCATRGQRGATGGLCSIEELPAVREQELRTAAQILRADVVLLDYEDQKLSAARPEEIRRELVALIRRLRPDVILTFDPNGANLHPDHVAISRFTSDAVAAAADARWYPASGGPHETRRLLWQSEIRVWELAGTPSLANCPGIDYMIDTSKHWRTKEAALRAHQTQMPGFGNLFFANPDGVERVLSVEAFRHGFGIRPRECPIFDLFQDLA